ncbi:MAG TPA: hypothetical protein VKT77_19435, partial [Chthonomonadaceae bacterium]|nr:hypothetical protein [Chthonomonadaceae bacterium]
MRVELWCGCAAALLALQVAPSQPQQPLAAQPPHARALVAAAAPDVAPQERRADGQAQGRQIEADDPADEEALNRELWETMTHRPYAEAVAHAARRQRETQPDATMSLPNGWRLAPAGRQTQVGRLPYT